MSDLIQRLQEPFPVTAHKQRQAGGGKMLTYVEGHTVIHRLNAATGNQWSFSVDKIERTQIDANNTLLMAYVTLTIPQLGSRSHIGVQSINARGGEDLVKGAVTDALKKAATLFGVGLELYGPDYEAGEVGEPRQEGRVDFTRLNTPPRQENSPQARTTPHNGNGEQRPTIANPGEPASEKQIKAIWAIARGMGMEDAELHEFAGVETFDGLSKGAASSVIDRLNQLRGNG